MFDQYYFNESDIIKAIRKVYNYSQAEFSKLMGYSQSAISKIENNSLSPDLRFVILLSEKINIDLNIFKHGHIHSLPKYILDNNLTKILPYEYTQGGFFSAKTAFSLIELLNKTQKDSLYKKVKIDREIFAISNLKFNFFFFKKITEEAGIKKSLKVLNEYFVSNPTPFIEDQFKELIKRYQILTIKKSFIGTKDHEFNLSLSDTFVKSHSDEDVQLFLSIIAFDILQCLNINIRVSKRTRNEFKLKVYIAA